MHLTYFLKSLFGVSLVRRGLSFGFSSCCVLDGLDMYGRS